MNRYLRHVLPSGMVMTTIVPEPEVTYAAYAGPMQFIPLKSPDEIAAEGRQEAAQQALAVLREATVLHLGPVLNGMPCSTCAFRQPPLLPPPRFQLPPFEFDFTELEKPSRLWHDFYGAVPPMHYPPLSSII